MLERESEFEVVGQVGSVAEAQALDGQSLEDVDVAIVDLALPDGDGLELLEDLSSRTATLVLSASLETGRFARAVESGASGVLHKAAPIKEIVDAVRRLRAGEALSAVLLEATRLALASCPLSQPLEVRTTRDVLRDAVLGGTLSPQIVIRLGWPGSDVALPATPRRPVEETIGRLPR